LTTVVTLRPVLTRENLDDMVARAAYLSDDETAYLVASLRPRQAPREGIRKLPAKPIPLHVKRAVRARDGNQCTYVSPDGKRCECRWQLEFDHIDPDSKDREPTVDDLRLRCKPHNIFAAEKRYGRRHMLRCRGREASRTGESALAGESDSE